jgi:hypothetical protein
MSIRAGSKSAQYHGELLFEAHHDGISPIHILILKLVTINHIEWTGRSSICLSNYFLKFVTDEIGFRPLGE